MSQPISPTVEVQCYHCGADCEDHVIVHDDKLFCCEGCKLVYELLQENELCSYYDFTQKPGVSPDKNYYAGKYAYLDLPEVHDRMIEFTDGRQTHINWYLPQMHCSSCVYLLENLHRLQEGVLSALVNFPEKKVRVVIDEQKVSLSKIAELLTYIGYEPYISLQDVEANQAPKTNRTRLYKIGISGFAFGNVMMMSFPDYFGLGETQTDHRLQSMFSIFSVVLALPVFFYGASDFFVSAWKAIRKRYLNIDAPIALAILVTFVRSLYEISTQTGVGYLDSMTGIVFFMLLGRYFQDKTYSAISFDRDYKSYFPVAVTKLGARSQKPEVRSDAPKTEDKDSAPHSLTTNHQVLVTDLQPGDCILIRNKELIPADVRLMSERAMIDYSFVSGESAPVEKTRNELIYAGGRQVGGAIEVEVTKRVSQSYLTQLWNNDSLTSQQKSPQSHLVDKINLYFSWILLFLGIAGLSYWAVLGDLSRGTNAITTILIVACPCALLLSDTFTNGNMLGMFGKHKFYLKNAQIIENLSKIDTIVFDKTGTLTLPDAGQIQFVGNSLTPIQQSIVRTLCEQSSHPLSRLIAKSLHHLPKEKLLTNFSEIEGKGIEATLGDNCLIRLGSAQFVTQNLGQTSLKQDDNTSHVYFSFGGNVLGYFEIRSQYRNNLTETLQALKQRSYQTFLLSGDKPTDVEMLAQLFGSKSQLNFNQKPDDKLRFIEKLQQQGRKVLMIGDGLNDAGALIKSDVGIAVSDNINNFSPACDGILEGSQLSKLPQFVRLAQAGRNIVIQSFIISVVYNIIGLSFALTGTLSPVVAAILMPASSISIVLYTTISSRIAAASKLSA